MVLPRKNRRCTICKKTGYTEWHHIISQSHARKTGQLELLDNPRNLVELCRRCHNQTTASMVRNRLLKQEKGTTNRKKNSRNRGKKRYEKVQTQLNLSNTRVNEETEKSLKNCGIWSPGLSQKAAENRLNAYRSHQHCNVRSAR